MLHDKDRTFLLFLLRELKDWKYSSLNVSRDCGAPSPPWLHSLFLLSYLSLSPFTSLYFTLSFSACFVSCVKVKRNSLGIGGCCLFYLPWFVLFLWCSCLVSLMNHLESWLKCVLVFSFWFPWLPCRPLLPTLLIVCCGKFLVWGLLYFCYFFEGECNAMNHWQTTTEPNGRATDHRKICYVFHSVLYTYIAKAMSVKIVVQCNQ